MANQDPVDKNKKETILQLYTDIGKLGRHRVKTWKNTITLDRGQLRVLYPDIIYGIEFEVENIRELRPAETWQHIFTIDKDGSLRNGGVEIKLCSKGEHLETALHFYDRNLPKEADFSFRTSIHVHVDVRDLTPEQAWNMIALSMLYERTFYRLAGLERKATAFCVPAGGTALPAVIRSHAANALEKEDYKNQLEMCRRNWSKYLGTNILTMHDFGTFEYRQMRGHRDMGLLVNWLNLLGALKQRTKQQPFKKLISAIRELNTNSHYLEFTRETFPGHSNILTRDEHFIQDMEQGVIFCKHAFSPVTKVLEFLRSVKEDSSYYRTFPSDIIHDKRKEVLDFGQEGDPEAGGGLARRLVNREVRFDQMVINAPRRPPRREKLTEAVYTQIMNDSTAWTRHVVVTAGENIQQACLDALNKQLDNLSGLYNDFDSGNVSADWNILWREYKVIVNTEYVRITELRNLLEDLIHAREVQQLGDPN